MKHDLKFDFSVDKETKTITVMREFNGNLGLVWDAWTKPEILDEWWAPKPYKTVTKSQDFRVGGTWLYYMVSPKNERHWCKADYLEIEVQKFLAWVDAFCDDNGVASEDKPKSHWKIHFSEQSGVTTVKVILLHDRLEDIETMIKMGFKEGFTMAMENLDELLAKNIS